MRRLSVVLLLAVYQANESVSYPQRRSSRDFTESSDELSSRSSDVDHPVSRNNRERVIRDTSIRKPSDESEMMDTAETHIFPPAFTMIENERKRERRNKVKSYLLVDVASVNDVPIVINAQVVPNDVNYLANYGFGGFGGFGGFRRK